MNLIQKTLLFICTIFLLGTLPISVLADDEGNVSRNCTAAGTCEEDYSDPEGIIYEKPKPCNYSATGTISVVDAINGCLEGADLVDAGTATNLDVGDGFKNKIIEWTKTIAGYLSLGAIFAIAFGSLRLTLSMGEEENIKKAKDIIKWGVIGFVAVISAGFFVALIVNLIYSIA